MTFESKSGSNKSKKFMKSGRKYVVASAAVLIFAATGATKTEASSWAWDGVRDVAHYLLPKYVNSSTMVELMTKIKADNYELSNLKQQIDKVIAEQKRLAGKVDFKIQARFEHNIQDVRNLKQKADTLLEKYKTAYTTYLKDAKAFNKAAEGSAYKVLPDKSAAFRVVYDKAKRVISDNVDIAAFNATKIPAYMKNQELGARQEAWKIELDTLQKYEQELLDKATSSPLADENGHADLVSWQAGYDKALKKLRDEIPAAQKAEAAYREALKSRGLKTITTEMHTMKYGRYASVEADLIADAQSFMQNIEQWRTRAYDILRTLGENRKDYADAFKKYDILQKALCHFSFNNFIKAVENYNDKVSPLSSSYTALSRASYDRGGILNWFNTCQPQDKNELLMYLATFKQKILDYNRAHQNIWNALQGCYQDFAAQRDELIKVLNTYNASAKYYNEKHQGKLFILNPNVAGDPLYNFNQQLVQWVGEDSRDLAGQKHDKTTSKFLNYVMTQNSRQLKKITWQTDFKSIVNDLPLYSYWVTADIKDFLNSKATNLPYLPAMTSVGGVPQYAKGWASGPEYYPAIPHEDGLSRQVIAGDAIQEK